MRVACVRPTATIGGESDVTPLARNCPMIHCCKSYSVNASFARTRREASANADCVMRSISRPAVDAIQAARASTPPQTAAPGPPSLLPCSLARGSVRRSRVHKRYIRDLVLRRILHGYFFRAPDKFPQILFQFLGRRVDIFSPGSESRAAASIRCTSLRGAPFAEIM